MKSIKNSLFVAAALAVALSFASCSNDTQDVYATNMGESYVNVGVMKGTVESEYYTSATIVSEPIAKVSYETGNKGNVRTYTVRFYVKNRTSSTSKESIYVYLDKVGNAYYYDGEKVTLDGSPEDDEFTIQTTIEYSGYKFKNLNFKKAE